jgi:uncharacterized membrane protein YedE/YeeE
LNSTTKPSIKVIGGLIFGLGWAMTGACPGPFAQMDGATVMIVTLLSAIVELGYMDILEKTSSLETYE